MTERLFWPSASKHCAEPPFTWNEKSEATFVPPLSFTTTFFTISVAGWSLFVTVQVAEPPFGMTRFEQFE